MRKIADDMRNKENRQNLDQVRSKRKAMRKTEKTLPEGRYDVRVSDIPEDVGNCIKQDSKDFGCTDGIAVKMALRQFYKSQGRI